MRFGKMESFDGSGRVTVEIDFHADAVKRFNEVGDKLREAVRVIKKTLVAQQIPFDPYPAASSKAEDVIGKITMTERICDGLGNEAGRLWTRGGEYVGLIDDAYRELKTVAKGFEKTPPLRGRVHVDFLVDEIFFWLQAALDGSGEPLVIFPGAARARSRSTIYGCHFLAFTAYRSFP
jgi:hypothetical protein